MTNLSAEVPASGNRERSEISVGPCIWIIDRQCPDENIGFYLFTRHNLRDRQYIHIDHNLKSSNISSSYFDPRYTVKIIIHGYNSDMFLQPLIEMKDEYLQRSNYNLIYVECYLSAVHKIKHTGACIAQLIERILDMGTDDIHLIGFSLGAQVTNFVAANLKSFKLPRITGDFSRLLNFNLNHNEGYNRSRSCSSSIYNRIKRNKLDGTDALFVDVIHTNALLQGKIERCGHVDFYMIIACSHHRAPDYYAESIRSFRGFWGWPCGNINYLLGLCPQTNSLVIAGEDCRIETRGMFLVTTNNVSPFALGRWVDEISGAVRNKPPKITFTRNDPLQQQIDPWGKLDGNFNNLEHFPTPYSQDPNGLEWPYFDSHTDDSLNLEEMKRTVLTASVIQNQESDNRSDTLLKLKQKLIRSETEPSFIKNYKDNLTRGFIDEEVFKMPQVILKN